ncbi:ankyrin repeat domain-containing protein [Ascidiimonas aurantiaca]|uniref:ankyrin repeat domain-containing protein n=1 Tax=Ascidiimonas aurantiaca TaxID=1685432 RepID=UPI0030EC0D30
MIIFLLKASVILIVLFTYYKLVLHKETFFVQNRIYLIGSLVLVLLLPFVPLPKFVTGQGALETKIEHLSSEVFVLSERPFSESENNNLVPYTSKTQSALPFWQERGPIFWVLIVYYFGVIVLLLNFLLQIASILIKGLKSSDKIYDTDSIIVNTVSVKEPCSFFNYIFINPKSYDLDTYELIISHEKIHVAKLHTLDFLLSEIMIILLWFNPFIWIFRKEIEKNIEYQTDDLVLAEGIIEKEDYQINLLKIATFSKPLVVTSNYNQSLIKQRIIKMNSKKSNPYSNWKYSFIVPILFLALLILNKPLSVVAQATETPIVGASESIPPSDSQTNTECKALIKAIRLEDTDQTKELLTFIDPNCIDKNLYSDINSDKTSSNRDIIIKRTPLVTAAGIGNLIIAEMLLKAGADVNFYARGDESPLMAASVNGNLDFVQYLIKNGARVNEKIVNNGTALLVASREGHLEIVTYLISKGAAINVQMQGDGTPLICAVRRGHYEVTKVLLENGADPNLSSPGDEYPMYHARTANNQAMITLLKEYESKD